MRRLLRAAFERFGWGVADQALSSLTNLALGVMVARSVSTRDFGAFSIAFLIYMSALGLSRALASNPLVVRFSTGSIEEWRAAARSAGGAAVALGVAVGLGCIGVGLLLEGTLGAALPPLGLTLPGLLLQDTWRFAFFARSTGKAAFLNDLAWAAVLFPGLGALIAFGHSTVGWIVLVWGGAAIVAALLGVLQAGTVPDPRAVWSWWRTHSDLSVRYAGEFAVASGANQSALYGIGAISGLASVGAIRGTALLLGPMNVLFAGLTLTAVPHGARVLLHSTQRLYRTSVYLSAGIATIAALWGGVLLLIPSSAGRALLYETWAPARELVLALTIMTVGRGMTLGAIVGLRALAEPKRSLRARSISSAAVLVGGIVGVAIADAEGAAWGFAISTLPEVIVWWGEFRSAIKGRRAGRVPVRTVPDSRRFEEAIDQSVVEGPTNTSL